MNREKLLCSASIALFILGLVFLLFNHSAAREATPPADPGAATPVIQFQDPKFFTAIQDYWISNYRNPFFSPLRRKPHPPATLPFPEKPDLLYRLPQAYPSAPKPGLEDLLQQQEKVKSALAGLNLEAAGDLFPASEEGGRALQIDDELRDRKAELGLEEISGEEWGQLKLTDLHSGKEDGPFDAKLESDISDKDLIRFTRRGEMPPNGQKYFIRTNDRYRWDWTPPLTQTEVCAKRAKAARDKGADETLKMIRECIISGLFAEARNELERLLLANAKDAQALLLLARLYHEKELSLGKAIETLEKSSLDDIGVHLALANYYAQVGGTDLSGLIRSRYESALALDPKSTLALSRLALLLIESNQYESAEKKLAELKSALGSKSMTEYSLASGLLELKRGDSKAALRSLTDAWNNFEDELSDGGRSDLRRFGQVILNAQGASHMRQGNLADARDKFKESLALYSYDAQTLLNLSNLYAIAGLYADSRTFMNRLADDLVGGEVYLGRGIACALQSLSEDPGAADALKRGLDEFKNFDENYLQDLSFEQVLELNYFWGILHFRNGDNEKANEKWTRCLEYDPGFEGTFIWLAELWDSVGRPGHVEALLRRAAENRPGNLGLRYGYARHLFELGRMQDAWTVLKSIPENSRDSRVKCALGYAAYRLGNPQDAKTFFKSIDAGDPLQAYAKNCLDAIQNADLREIIDDDDFETTPSLEFIFPGWDVQQGGGVRIELNGHAAQVKGQFTDGTGVVSLRKDSGEKGFRFNPKHFVRLDVDLNARQIGSALDIILEFNGPRIVLTVAPDGELEVLDKDGRTKAGVNVLNREVTLSIERNTEYEKQPGKTDAQFDIICNGTVCYTLRQSVNFSAMESRKITVSLESSGMPGQQVDFDLEALRVVKVKE